MKMIMFFTEKGKTESFQLKIDRKKRAVYKTKLTSTRVLSCKQNN